MMKTLRLVLVCLLIAVGTAAAQDWKGKAVLGGTVTDPSGKAIDGATVNLTFVELKTGTTAKTNGKGEWQVKNVANGVWAVTITKDGFDPKQFEVEVGGQMKNPHVDVKLTPAGAPGSNAAVAEGDQKARALIADKKFAEARAIYQDLLAKNPQVVRLHVGIAQTYYGENQFAQAAEELKLYLDVDKQNTQLWGFYAVMNAQAGNVDEALRVLTGLPAEAVKESVDMQDCGIALLRAKKPADAVKFFDLAVARFPNEAINYFYRGLAASQIGSQVEKPGTPESKAQFDKAKADLEKFVSMSAPDAPQVDQAKKILQALK